MSNDNKTLADVQPGGRVRLGDQAALKRLHAHLTAYPPPCNPEDVAVLGAVLSAQPSPVAYHGDVDLKWLSGSIGEVAHRLSTYMPTGLAEWADRARDCRIAAQVLSELSAQPSPGGQDALIDALADDVESCVSDACGYLASDSGWDDYGIYRDDAAERYRALPDRIRELAARQPVGEQVAWLVHWSDMPLESPEVTRSASRISEVSALTNSPRIVPLYAVPPAQAVDLGRIRSTVQALLNWIDDWAETPEESGIDAIEIEAVAVLDLIDSQGVQS